MKFGFHRVITTKTFLTSHPNFPETLESLIVNNKNWTYIDFITTLLRKVMNMPIKPTDKYNLRVGKFEI
jgi:hypothetical protein